MSSVVPVKVGKYTYLYESVSYRNDEGKPRNRRKLVSKVDPVTGQYVYKPEYMERMALAPVQPAVASFSTEDIRRSSIRDYGAFYLYHKLAEQMGLLDALRKSLPGRWEEIFNLAAYLVSTGDPFAYCEDWIASTEALPVRSLTSQRVSDLLANISKDARDEFYQLWCSLRSEQEYLTLDITSTSSYSEMMDSVE